MKLFVCAVLVFLAAFASVQCVDVMPQFLNYIQKFGKSYSELEFPMRYANFQSSLARISQKNKEQPGVFGLTKFSDMSTEEFSNFYLNKKMATTPDSERKYVSLPSASTIPNSWDWRSKGAVTAVKNQKQCGSCWAFSVTEAVESAWILAGKATNTTIDLAPQQIVDCDTVDQGCDGGDPPTAYAYIEKAGGLESESSYPYKAEDGTCKFEKSKVVASISGWRYATKAKNESMMVQSLTTLGPLSICVDASSWQDYTSGVLKHCGQTLDHCVQLVGYDFTKSKYSEDYYIVRNSWGVNDWGVDGYIYVEYGHNLCGIANEATFPTAG